MIHLYLHIAGGDCVDRRLPPVHRPALCGCGQPTLRDPSLRCPVPRSGTLGAVCRRSPCQLSHLQPGLQTSGGQAQGVDWFSGGGEDHRRLVRTLHGCQSWGSGTQTADGGSRLVHQYNTFIMYP